MKSARDGWARLLERDMSEVSAAVSLEYDTPELASTYEEASVIQFNHGQILIDQLRIRPGERVLDIGAGTGRLAEYVANLVGPTGQVVGIDPLQNRVAIARSRESKILRFEVGRAEELQAFHDGQFDVVFLNSVFHWIEDKSRALSEISRVLKNGGRIGLNTQDPSRPHESRLLIRSALLQAGFDDRRAHPILGCDDGTLQALFAAASFGGYRSELYAFVDFHDDVDSLIRWSESSAFGNFLADFSKAERERVSAALATLVEANRTPSGLKLERYLRFVTAVKLPSPAIVRRDP